MTLYNLIMRNMEYVTLEEVDIQVGIWNSWDDGVSSYDTPGYSLTIL